MNALRSVLGLAGDLLRRWETLLFLLILVAMAWSNSISPFFASQSLFDLIQSFVAIGLMALGLALVVIAGEIDISITSTLALTAVVFAMAWRSGVALPVAAAGAVLLGALLGLINGILVSRFNLPALAVTLGTQAAFRGVAFVLLATEGVTGFPTDFTRIGFGDIGETGIPVAVVVLIIFGLLFAVLLHTTRFGRHLYVVGASKETARFSGVPVRRVRVTVFVLSGVMAAVAGLIYAGFFNTVRADIATEDLLDVITAVVLGGVDIFGGSGSILGVLLSLVLIAVMRKGMSLANISSPVQGMVIGVLLVIAILAGNLLKRRLKHRRAVAAPRVEEVPVTSVKQAQ